MKITNEYDELKAWVWGIVILLPLLVLYLALGIRVVSPTEIAVVERMGEIVAVKSSGVHYGLRFVDKYNKIDLNQQNMKEEYSTATKDMQSVNEIVNTQYTIDSSKAKQLYLKFLGQHKTSIIQPILSQSVKEITSGYTIEELISKRAELGEKITESAKERLSEYGINVVSIQVVNLELPEEYKKAVEQKKVAEQQVLKAQAELEEAKIKAESNKVISQTFDQNVRYKEFLAKWNGQLPNYIGDGNALNMLLPSIN